MPVPRKPVALDDHGVMLATSCLQLQLYRTLGEHLDRQAAYGMAVLIVQEYFRGAARGTAEAV